MKVVSDAMGADEPLRSRRRSRLRELDEDDFESESDDEFEFKLDEERVMGEYGEEEQQPKYV